MLLQLEEIDVRFGGVQALDSATVDVGAAGITGLIGPNGAGKTTLFNVACGLQAAVRGRVMLEGRDITRLRPHRRARLGLGRTFQRLEVFGSMTVRENVLVAAEIRRLTARDRRLRPMHTTEQLLETMELRAVADDRVDAVPTGVARMVELARALAAAPRVLLLDEPSSGLDETETRALAALLQRVASAGTGMLLVEHDMDLVMDVCERIHVLDFGRVIASGTPAQVRGNAAVRAAYLGVQEPQRSQPDDHDAA